MRPSYLDKDRVETHAEPPVLGADIDPRSAQQGLIAARNQAEQRAQKAEDAQIAADRQNAELTARLEDSAESMARIVGEMDVARGIVAPLTVDNARLTAEVTRLTEANERLGREKLEAEALSRQLQKDLDARTQERDAAAQELEAANAKVADLTPKEIENEPAADQESHTSG